MLSAASRSRSSRAFATASGVLERLGKRRVDRLAHDAHRSRPGTGLAEEEGDQPADERVEEGGRELAGLGVDRATSGPTPRPASPNSVPRPSGSRGDRCAGRCAMRRRKRRRGAYGCRRRSLRLSVSPPVRRRRPRLPPPVVATWRHCPCVHFALRHVGRRIAVTPVLGRLCTSSRTTEEAPGS
jgi:hypothetical protein